MIYTWQNFPYIYIKETECQKRRKGNQGRRDNHIKYKDLTCAFDIETTNDDESQQAFMYIWQCQIDDYTIIGRTWGDYLRFLSRIIDGYTTCLLNFSFCAGSMISRPMRYSR